MHIGNLDVSLSVSWSLLYACRVFTLAYDAKNDCMYNIVVIYNLGICLCNQKSGKIGKWIMG